MDKKMLTFICSFDYVEQCYPGKILYLRPEPENTADNKAVAVFNSPDENGERMGYLSAKPSTSLSGCQTSHDIFDDVSSCGGNIVLISKGKVTTKKAVMTAWLCELYLLQTKAAASNTEVKGYDILIEGSQIRNPAKSGVSADVISGKTIALYLEKNDEDIVVKKPGEPDTAGVVSEKTPDTVMKELERQLKRRNVLPVVTTGKIEKARSTINYYVHVEIGGDPTEDYSKEIGSLTSKCICTKEEIQEKIDFMISSGFGRELITAVLQNTPFYLPDDRINIPKPEVPYVQDSGNNLARVVGYAIRGRNIRAFGPKGGGKNTMIETALWLMGRPMYRMSVSGDIDKYDVLGGPALKDGETTTTISDMLTALTKGYCVIFDEANSARAEVLEVIHSLTDGARAVQVPGYGLVKMADNALVMMTMNEGYVGCGEMNEATIDRFVPIEVAPESNIRNLLKHMVPTASDDDIASCCKVHESILNGIKQKIYSENCISLRGFKDALLTVPFVSLNQGLVDNIANKSQDEDERKSLTSLINDVVSF